jgi:hypothetical protein
MKLVYPPCYPLCSCEPWREGGILQPWAFWTSLLYFVALWFVWKRNPRISKAWISAVALVALASMLAHASFDVYSLAVDESAVVVALLSYHLKAEGWARAIISNLLIIGACTALFVWLPLPLWVPVVFVAFIFSAWLAVKKKGTKIFYEREFLIAMSLYGISFLMFSYDRHPLLCGTAGLPYGHPTWHVGSALVTYLLGDWWFKEDLQKSESNSHRD